jgi:hypothetical protein
MLNFRKVWQRFNTFSNVIFIDRLDNGTKMFCWKSFGAEYLDHRLGYFRLLGHSVFAIERLVPMSNVVIEQALQWPPVLDISCLMDQNIICHELYFTVEAKIFLV